MKVTDKLKWKQFKEFQQMYSDFFEEIDFNNQYSSSAINTFARKKVIDSKKRNPLEKFYFVINDDKIVGFIHGKLSHQIGLISHAYVLEEYRNSNAFLILFRKMLRWFKKNNVSVMEIEVAIDNPIRETVERLDWSLYQEFDDANVYHRKI